MCIRHLFTVFFFLSQQCFHFINNCDEQRATSNRCVTTLLTWKSVKSSFFLDSIRFEGSKKNEKRKLFVHLMQSKISCNTFAKPMPGSLHEMNVKCGPFNVWVCLQPFLWEQMGWRAHRRWDFVNCIRAYDANFPQRCQVTNCILLMQCIKRMRILQFTNNVNRQHFWFNYRRIIVQCCYVRCELFILSFEFIARVFYCWCSRMRFIIKCTRGFPRFSRWIHQIEFNAHYPSIRGYHFVNEKRGIRSEYFQIESDF